MSDIQLEKEWQDLFLFQMEYRKANYDMSIKKFLTLLDIHNNCIYLKLFGPSGDESFFSFSEKFMREIISKLKELKRKIENEGISFEDEPISDRIIELGKERCPHIENGFSIQINKVDLENKNIIVHCSITIDEFNTITHIYAPSNNPTITKMNHEILTTLIKKCYIKNNIFDCSWNVIILDPIKNYHYL